MKNLPKSIYLNFGEIEGDEVFNDLDEVTWSIDKINDHDKKFILLDNNLKNKFYRECVNKRILKNNLHDMTVVTDVQEWINKTPYEMWKWIKQNILDKK